MKVIVTITPTSTLINEDMHEDWVDEGVDIKVRKCPPNYEPLTSFKWYELVAELEDYTEEDIKEYFEKPQIWGRRHEDPEKEQYISLMHEEDA